MGLNFNGLRTSTGINVHQRFSSIEENNQQLRCEDSPFMSFFSKMLLLLVKIYEIKDEERCLNFLKCNWDR